MRPKKPVSLIEPVLNSERCWGNGSDDARPTFFDTTPSFFNRDFAPVGPIQNLNPGFIDPICLATSAFLTGLSCSDLTTRDPLSAKNLVNGLLTQSNRFQPINQATTLLQQCQDVLRHTVGLRQHRNTRLLQNLRFR